MKLSPLRKRAIGRKGPKGGGRAEDRREGYEKERGKEWRAGREVGGKRVVRQGLRNGGMFRGKNVGKEYKLGTITKPETKGERHNAQISHRKRMRARER